MVLQSRSEAAGVFCEGGTKLSNSGRWKRSCVPVPPIPRHRSHPLRPAPKVTTLNYELDDRSQSTNSIRSQRTIVRYSSIRIETARPSPSSPLLWSFGTGECR